MKLSLVIPAKSKDDPKLAELLRSIEAQDFPREELEVLVITKGTSESAKAIGIRQAKGEVIGILASDNELIGINFLKNMTRICLKEGSCYPAYYWYDTEDNVLNRYFSLIGGNDPLAYYMNKNDKLKWTDSLKSPSSDSAFGDNGFFVRKDIIIKSDLENYFHVDNVHDVIEEANLHCVDSRIWHKTGGNLLNFFKKRYHYGLQHAFNSNRRWHLVDFRQPKDIMRLIWFVICSVTLVEPLILSFRGFLKIRDVAWFLHPVACLMTLTTYSLLVIRLGLSRLFPSSSAPTAVQKA